MLKDTSINIDFVLPWVDGNDPLWIESFNKHAPKEKNISIDIALERYRNENLLKYWFRCIEQNAKWVHKIFFITNGQMPQWLNLANKKLILVKHEDYIPSKYLPVFSANPIEIYLHLIEELSENFVYFNDDMYLINPVDSDYFFLNNLPRDFAILKPIHPSYFEHITLNDLIEINKFYNKKDVIKNNIWKYINYKYGKYLLQSCYFSRLKSFPGFLNKHMPQAFLKKTFREVWKNCENTLLNTSLNKFRNIADVNQYLFRYWQLVNGDFIPQTDYKNRKYYDVNQGCLKDIRTAIKSKHIKEICLNDEGCPDECYLKIEECFEERFPIKSTFEK
jgi:hypothetical protein